jgi:hypothetical protein
LGIALKSLEGTLFLERDLTGLMTLNEQLNIVSFLLKTLGID